MRLHGECVHDGGNNVTSETLVLPFPYPPPNPNHTHIMEDKIAE